MEGNTVSSKGEESGGSLRQSTTLNRIDGNKIAATIREELKLEIQSYIAAFPHLPPPGLGVLLVGDSPDSTTYVRMKEKAAKEIGINFTLKTLPDTSTQEEILAAVEALNSDANIHGLIVQLPLPRHVDEKLVLDRVSLEKDVDGFHPLNIGTLAIRGRRPLFAPCTPLGCMELLKRSGVKIDGARVVVIGRSNIVGIPLSLMLVHANATVTICHSKSVGIEDICRQADILIIAIGQPKFVKKEWVKEGVVVIDVGINSVPSDDPKKPAGSKRLVGDVDYNEVKKVASLITPVPGGVGPMTVAMLLRSTVTSAKRHAASAPTTKVPLLGQ